MNNMTQSKRIGENKHLGVNIWDKIIPYIFILPFFITFIVFFLFPSIYSLVLSFFSYRGYGEAKFVGFDNYINTLNYSVFWMGVNNTVFYFLVHIVPVMVLAFLLAAAMHSKLISSRHKLYKPVLFLPQVMPIIAGALSFRILFSTNIGPINQFFGLKIDWLNDIAIARWTVIVLISWRAVGWFMVVYLAGLTTISSEITDATFIDGANTYQRYIFVTIPMMKPIFLFAFIIDAIVSIKIFTEPNILLSPAGSLTQAKPDLSPVINVMVNNITGGYFGKASAVGWLIFIMVLFVTVLQFKFFKDKEI